MKPSTICVASGFLALGFVTAALDGVLLPPSALSRMTTEVQLRLRRSPGRVDVVIPGLGKKIRAVSQNQSDRRWSARLTGFDLGDQHFAPQQRVLESSELLSVRLEPLDSDLQLIVNARIGERVPTPTIGFDGESLVVSFAGLKAPDVKSRGHLDLSSPGRVAQPLIAPPLRPRAVAPPLGDMAVGTMLIRNRSFVKASGPPVSLTFNKTPAKDALMSLARLGGYGFVFVADPDTATGDGGDGDNYRVTMALHHERYDRALNSVLMSSGLEGRLEGNLLLVGTSVAAKNLGPHMSKVYRLNQVDVASAGKFLGNLGADIKVTNTVTTTSSESESSGTDSNGSQSSTSSSSTGSKADSYSSEEGPLVGLVGTTDSRLNTITLVGDPILISVAQSYLKQIDLRKRQVAVKVQIVNVDLLNGKTSSSNFSTRIGDVFLVNDGGKAYVNFGALKPGSSSGAGAFNGGNIKEPGRYDETKPSSPFDYPKNSFYSYLQAAIESSSAKTLAQPTLLVQEGQEAKVVTGTSVITSVSKTDSSNGSTQYSYQRENAGLELKVKVSKIDDNGFISLSLNPKISVPEPAGKSDEIPIFNISGRTLSSGSIRLRDRQTLVLTGVIQDVDREVVTKWPILSDLPFIGQLFRSSGSNRSKNELVVLVTPSIIDDESGGNYGYGFRPDASAVRDLIRTGSS